MAQDCAYDDEVHRRQAEGKVAKLKQKLFEAEQATIKAQETARQYEKNYHETRASLERVRTESQKAPGWADKVLIKSLEHQLNDANQQLAKLHVGHHPSATEGQLATQPSQANEQLEVLQIECNALHDAVTQEANEHNIARRHVEMLQTLNLRLQATLLGGSSASAPDSELQEWCAKAEAKVTALQKENDLLKEIIEGQSMMFAAQDRATQEKEGSTATSTSLRPLSFPALSGRESGLISQASPPLGED